MVHDLHRNFYFCVHSFSNSSLSTPSLSGALETASAKKASIPPERKMLKLPVTISETDTGDMKWWRQNTHPHTHTCADGQISTHPRTYRDTKLCVFHSQAHTLTSQHIQACQRECTGQEESKAHHYNSHAALWSLMMMMMMLSALCRHPTRTRLPSCRPSREDQSPASPSVCTVLISQRNFLSSNFVSRPEKLMILWCRRRFSFDEPAEFNEKRW